MRSNHITKNFGGARFAGWPTTSQGMQIIMPKPKYKKYKKHKTVVLTRGDMSAKIDENIAPLIDKCWQHSIKTLHCCEGWDDDVNGLGLGYIHFATSNDALKFVHMFVPKRMAMMVDRRPMYEVTKQTVCLRFKRTDMLKLRLLNRLVTEV